MLKLFYTPRQAEDLALFIRHIAGAMEAKVPLPKILEAYLMECEKSRLSRAVEDILERVETGVSLAEAMHHHPKVFPPLIIRMVYLGEKGRILGGVMDELASSLEKGLKAYDIARRCAIYPLIAMTVLFFIFTFINVMILPKIGIVLSQMGGEIPAVTNANYLPFLNLFLILPIALLLSAALGLRLRLITPGRFILSLPIIGHVLRLIETSRFSHNLSMLIRNRMPMAEALELISESATNTYTQAAIKDFQERYEQGERLGEMLSGQPLFPPSMAVMVSSAEDQGGLAETLDKLGDHYDQRITHSANVIREIAEPLLIVIAGVFLSIVLMGIFLPLFRIPQQIGTM